MEKVLIFANPIAGRGKGRKIARRLEKRLKSDGYEVALVTDNPETVDVSRLPAPARAAIVIGGDGTLRSVAERLFFSNARIENAPPLLVVPLGTANLMGQHLGIRWDDARLEEQVSAAVGERRVRWVDTARANGRLFLLIAGVGFDAHVVHEMARVRKGPIRYTSYALPAALAVLGYRYPRIEVVLDGRRVFGPASGVAFIGNVAEYGTGFPMLPEASSDDGLLDVCVLPCSAPTDLANWLLHALAGEHPHQEGVVYLKGKSVRITSPDDGETPVQLDGDAAGHTPLSIDLLPVRLPFIVREVGSRQ